MCKLGGCVTAGGGLLLRGLPDVKNVDKGGIKATVGETGEALTWGTAGIAGCILVSQVGAGMLPVPLDIKTSAAGCTALYGAFVTAEAFQRDLKSK